MTTANPLPKLHVITDPYCGWCYACAPLLDSMLQDTPEIAIELHCGGMLTGTHTRPVTPEFRSFVLEHDDRITKMTGLPFSTAYSEKLLRNNGIVFDSTQPTTAILAAQELDGKAIQMMHALQHAMYIDGLHISDEKVIRTTAEKIGLDVKAFEAEYKDILENETAHHIAQSRNLLIQLGGQGFPTFALELTTNQWQPIDIGPFLGHTNQWIEFLKNILATHNQYTDNPNNPPSMCDLNGNCY